jgi:hypothetical protein
MSLNTQWLFIISDTNSQDNKVVAELEKSVDGDNIAFLYNYSSSTAASCNVNTHIYIFVQELLCFLTHCEP